MKALLIHILACGLCLFWPIRVAAQAAPGPASGINAAHEVVDIATGPLYQGAGRVHPNVLLALSVEFPTVGIAYTQPVYDRNKDYIGYFNHRMCYAYLGLPDDGYFSPVDHADPSHECSNGKDRHFSGNFLNWAAASAIDSLRYAMTGGDRIVDELGKTVLQRAYLPEFFYASTDFPARILRASGTSGRPSKVTPFEGESIVVVSCRNRVYFGTSAEKLGDCDDPKMQGNLGRYLARVEVCNEKDAASRPELCRRYGKHFKPVGEMQKRANEVRLGAFGYLMENSRNRYGGVLRAPMKYVGPKRYDARFASRINEQKEWDPDSGIFLSNPEGAKNGNSGVINYLNQFGRSGRYKQYDPVSELFYEAIRYYRNLGPTPEAAADLTSAMSDGFQVVRSWDDPVLASCQKNYVISIADANTHCDKSVPGNRRGSGKCENDDVKPGNDPVNFVQWTDKVGNLEGRPNLSSVSTGATDASYYLAGIAYWANTQDIRPDLQGKQSVRTFSIDVDEYGTGRFDQARARQLYYAGKYGGFQDLNGDGNPYRTVDPDNNARQDFESGLEWETEPGSAIPQAYFMASEPARMVDSIRRIFDQIAEGNGTMAPLGMSAAKATPGGNWVYRTGFHPRRWSGSLASIELKADDQNQVALGKVRWEAGKQLTENLTDEKRLERKIYTLTPDGQGKRFAWSEIGEVLQRYLNTDPASGIEDGLGRQRLEYLHGMRAREQHKPDGIFRSRDSVLGDMVNSGPVYVGSPTPTINDAGYASFYENFKKRPAAVYVGANDGMLHAFHAVTGKELFAYIPRAVFPELAKLTDPDYQHRPYVDATPSIAEAQVGTRWKTVLASGFGGGAQGVFALDVSDPEKFGASSILWEFTDRDDPDIGNVMGEVQIAKFRVGANAYRWFVVVSSGLNSNIPDGAANDKAPKALFLLALNKNAEEKWKQGVNYWKLPVVTHDRKLPDGLGPPGLVFGNQREVIAAYAGDLQGNLWKFDFGSATAITDRKATGTRLFQAKLESEGAQPMTARPRVVFAPGGGYLILFGTGKFWESKDADPSHFATQSFYAVLDRKDRKAEVTRSSLARRTLSVAADGALTIRGASYALGYAKKGTDATDTRNVKAGWYVDFHDSGRTGERSITPAAVGYGQVFFNTMMFDTDPCKDEAGRSYALDILTGLAKNSDDPVGGVSEVGMLAMPSLFEISGEAGNLTATGVRSVRKRYAIVSSGTRGVRTGRTDERSVRDGQLSWREIVNFQQLKQVAQGSR